MWMFEETTILASPGRLFSLKTGRTRVKLLFHEDEGLRNSLSFAREEKRGALSVQSARAPKGNFKP